MNAGSGVGLLVQSDTCSYLVLVSGLGLRVRNNAQQYWRYVVSLKTKKRTSSQSKAGEKTLKLIFDFSIFLHTYIHVHTRFPSGVVNCSQGVMQEKCITMEKAFPDNRPEGRVMQRVRMKEHMKRMLRRLLRRLALIHI